MVISSDKSNVVRLICIFVIVVLASFLFALQISIVSAIILFVCSTLIIVLHYVAIGRTIIMEEGGCKIMLLGHSKEYTWHEIRIKRLEPPHLGLRNSYHHGGAFFSVNKVSKPRWLDPALYCTFFHPTSCFFVYFVKRDVNERICYLPGVYEADKQAFVEQLQLWNVELDK